MLEAGGNAFDAAIAAQFAACVAEPVLASLGGGGYLLARPANADPLAYDFFSHTPRVRRETGVDFYPIEANFGSVVQEFNIGAGTVATPGMVRGAFAVWRDLATLPMEELVRPAVDIARQGAIVTEMQAYIFRVVEPIYRATSAARRTFVNDDGNMPAMTERFPRPELGDVIESIAIEGEDLFYKGEIGARIVDVCKTSGHLRAEDLLHYEVVRRDPLQLDYRGARIVINPPPACGGVLIAFALQLMAELTPDFRFGEADYLELLAEVMAATNKARVDLVDARHESILDDAYLARYRTEVASRATCLSGTTHISVVDEHGNIAATSLSNGEGCGIMVPGTGFMLNNMLGEEDINLEGLGNWRPDQRMVSMMSPAIVEQRDRVTALGSGGSNRIRSAILQTIVNLVDFGMPLNEAIESPRIHFENDKLSVEGGFAPDCVAELARRYDSIEHWEGANLFFGGVHAVQSATDRTDAFGDPRRGGIGVSV